MSIEQNVDIYSILEIKNLRINKMKEIFGVEYLLIFDINDKKIKIDELKYPFLKWIFFDYLSFQVY